MVPSAFPSGDCEPVGWVPDALGVASTWLWGMLAGLGLLGALACETLPALDPFPDEELGAGLGAGAATGAGAALLGALPVEECCANTTEENNQSRPSTRPESRITHLPPTGRSERQIALFLWTSPPTQRISRNRVNERSDRVKNCRLALGQILEYPCRAHSAAHAHGNQAVTSLASLEFADNRCRQLSPRATQRMSQSDRAAIGVYLIWVEPSFFDHCQRLRGESFVQLDHVDVREL